MNANEYCGTGGVCRKHSYCRDGLCEGHPNNSGEDDRRTRVVSRYLDLTETEQVTSWDVIGGLMGIFFILLALAFIAAGVFYWSAA
jgi:hypothetical protein